MPYKDEQKYKEYQKSYYYLNKNKICGRKKNNRTAINKTRLEHRRNNPELYLYKFARIRAKKFGLEFDLDVTDIIIPEFCPALGIPLKPNITGVKGASEGSPTLDRINNDKGYVKGNIHIISYKANRIKNNATVEELEKLLNYLKSKQS